MSKGKSSAFTMVEICVVLSIIAVLAAISYPVIAAVKRSAQQSVCFAHLHQLELALTMYRTNYDGDGVYGKASAMGLPNDFAMATVGLPNLLNTPLGVFRCGGTSGPVYKAAYYVMFTDKDNSAPPVYESWEQYAQRVQDQAVVLIDPNHGDPTVPLTSLFFTHHVFAVRLTGSVQAQSKAGDWDRSVFWDPK